MSSRATAGACLRASSTASRPSPASATTLLALEDAPEAAVDVRLSFTPDALELHVSGPPAANVDLRAVLAAARERAGLHGGTVDSRLAGGVCYAMARLPLVSGHA